MIVVVRDQEVAPDAIGGNDKQKLRSFKLSRTDGLAFKSLEPGLAKLTLEFILVTGLIKTGSTFEGHNRSDI